MSGRTPGRTPGRTMVRAIFFDAGNTLIRMNFTVVAEYLATLGIAVAPNALVASERQARVRLDTDVLAPRTEGASTESRPTHDAYLRYVLEGVGVRNETVVRALADWRRGYNQPVGLWDTPEPEAEAALRLSREAGLSTAVISNSNGSIRSIMETLGLARYLDLVVDSHEVGVEKPDPRIFRLALDRLGVVPAEGVYVGDLYSIDVRGARAVGLDAILLDPAGCWGERDCRRAPDVLAAVRLVLGT